MSALARYFFGCDDRKKGNEVVNDEIDDVSSSVCILPSPHFSYAAFDPHLLSEGVCWRFSTPHSYDTFVAVQNVSAKREI